MSAKEQTDTPTPRTDEWSMQLHGKRLATGGWYVKAEDCRQLETDYLDLKEDVRRLVEQITIKRDEAKKAINDAHGSGDYNRVYYSRGKKEAFNQVLSLFEANNPSLKPE